MVRCFSPQCCVCFFLFSVYLFLFFCGNAPGADNDDGQLAEPNGGEGGAPRTNNILPPENRASDPTTILEENKPKLFSPVK